MGNEKKERDKKKEEYEEGLKKTLIPSLFGILAGVISALVVNNPTSTDGLLILILLIMVQKFVYPFVHTNLTGAKDWIYISFMTFFCWIITYTLLLNY
jgi:hypothetical protein